MYNARRRRCPFPLTDHSAGGGGGRCFFVARDQSVRSFISLASRRVFSGRKFMTTMRRIVFTRIRMSRRQRDPYCRDLLSNHKRIFLSLLRRAYCPRTACFIIVSVFRSYENSVTYPAARTTYYVAQHPLAPGTSARLPVKIELAKHKGRAAAAKKNAARTARVYDYYLDHTVAGVYVCTRTRMRGEERSRKEPAGPRSFGPGRLDYYTRLCAHATCIHNRTRCVQVIIRCEME